MSTATFTVPLTARVLRAILADMEGTAAGCGCNQSPVAPVPEVKDYSTSAEVAAWQQLIGKVSDFQGVIREIAGVTLNDDDYAAIAYLCDEFDYAFEGTGDVTSGIVEEGNPFVATAPVAIPAAPVPFAVLTATEYFTTAPITLPSVTADEALLAACQEPSSGLPPVPMPPATVTPPTPSAPPATVPLDGEGLPWDKRIHASTKTFRQSDNTWKLAKGVDKDLVERVKAELRATMSAGTVPTAPAPPATVAHLSGSYVAPNYSGAQSGGYAPLPTIAAVETVQTTTVPQPPSVTAAVPPPVPAAPTAPEPVATPAVFSDFVTWVTGKLVAKEFSRDQLQAACAAEGITSMPMLENRPDLVPAIWKFLESICIPMTSVGGA